MTENLRKRFEIERLLASSSNSSIDSKNNTSLSNQVARPSSAILDTEAQGEKKEEDGEDFDEDFDEELEGYIKSKRKKPQAVRVREFFPCSLSIYDKKGIEEAVEDSNKLMENVPFLEHFSRTSKTPMEVDDDEDPFELELKIVRHTIPVIAESLEELEKNGIPTDRPNDYFAEMIKSDEHMFKIKNRLKKSKEVLELRERKRVDKDYKKLSKAIQQRKVRERSKEKQDNLKAIQAWKKHSQRAKLESRKGKNVEVPDFDRFMKNFKAEKKQMYEVTRGAGDNDDDDSKNIKQGEGKWLEEAMSKMKVGARNIQGVGGYGIRKIIPERLSKTKRRNKKGKKRRHARRKR